MIRWVVGWLGPVAFVCALVAATVVFGCNLPAKHPALDVLACKAAALAPYVGDSAREVVTQIDGGAVDPVRLLQSLDVSPKDALTAAKAYQACRLPAAPVEVADAGVQ